MKPALTFLAALLLEPLAALSAQTKALAKPDPNFIASPEELKARIATRLHITKPHCVVFVSEAAEAGGSDMGNEHFLVFDGRDGSLMSVLMQSSVENSSPDTPPDPRSFSRFKSRPYCYPKRIHVTEVPRGAR